MKLKASDKRVPLDVVYVDERIERGPLVCVQRYFDGTRTGETCDRKHRDPEQRGTRGACERDPGKLGGPLAGSARPAGGSREVRRGGRAAGCGVGKGAQHSGRAMYPVAMATSGRIELDNWDRTAINLPCGRVALVATGPILVARDADDAALETARPAV